MPRGASPSFVMPLLIPENGPGISVTMIEAPCSGFSKPG